MKLFTTAVAAAALLLTPQIASAQTTPSPTEALSSCVTNATTDADKIVLMRWLFVAMSRHPSVTELANVSDAQRVDANRQMGALVNKLLLDACPNQTRAAVASGGEQALQAAFSAFGAQAMRTLMNNPDVNAGVIEMTAYLDQQRLAALITPH